MSSISPYVAQEDQTALFRKSWTLYDAISEKNYMFHREIYAEVAKLLNIYHERGSYKVLDLGCGNARFMAPLLHAYPPAAYDGVDLSSAALMEAKDYLKGLPSVTLHQADMLQALEEHSGLLDVIFTGYAVHHLSSESKQCLFRTCARRLSPGGCLLMVDVARQEEESRESYLQGYIHTMRTQWTEVLPEHLEEACAHVASFDFPETISELNRMARLAGLPNMKLLSRHAQHHTFLFKADSDADSSGLTKN